MLEKTLGQAKEAKKVVSIKTLDGQTFMGYVREIDATGFLLTAEADDNYTSRGSAPAYVFPFSGIIRVEIGA